MWGACGVSSQVLSIDTKSASWEVGDDSNLGFIHMARPLRIEYEGAFYHVLSRGDRKGRIYFDDADKRIFLNYLKRTVDRFNIIIHAFVLMENHYHMLIETPHANLSSAMRYLNGTYTQAFNRRHKRVGHVLQGRYKAIVVDKDEYYLELVRYVHLNPLRAGLVENIDGYFFCSHRAIIDKSVSRLWREWYDPSYVLINFGRRREDALKSYCDFIAAGARFGREVHKGNWFGYILGGDGFADWVVRNFVDRDRVDRRISGSLKFRKGFRLREVLSSVGRLYGLGSSDLTKIKRGCGSRNEARGLAMYLLARYSQLTHEEIGKHFGHVSGAAVGLAARVCEQKLLEDKSLRKNHDALIKILRIS